MLWNKRKKEGAYRKLSKLRFDNLMSVAERLPLNAVPDLLRAIVRPVQSDLLLAVAEEGTDARPDMTPQEFFFSELIHIISFEKMKECELDGASYPLSLAIDMVLPWPWSLSRYIDNISYIGGHKGHPWEHDSMNHYVDLWLPWRIGFVRGGNHSISAGILAGEGELIPEHVYDMSHLFGVIRSDGINWFVDGHTVEPVKSWRSAAVFEIGRLLV